MNLLERPLARRVALSLVDLILLALAWVVAYVARLGIVLPVYPADDYQTQMLMLLPWVILSQVGLFWAFRVYHVGAAATLGRVLGPVALATFVHLVGWVLANTVLESQEGLAGLPITESSPGEFHVLRVPFGVLLLNAVWSLLLVCGMRLAGRLMGGVTRGFAPEARRALIVGAGPAADRALRELLAAPEPALNPVAAVAVDPRRAASTVRGVPVRGSLEAIAPLLHDEAIDTVIIALDEATPQVLRGVVEACKGSQAALQIVPSYQGENRDGGPIAGPARAVRLEDLICAPQTDLKLPEDQEYLQARRVLITGAGGTVGRELARLVAGHGPSELILLGRGETAIREVSESLHLLHPGLPIREVIANVCDENRMAAVFGRLRPQVVFHAAAHKHVELMEDSPAEAIKNNVVGTAITAFVAAQAGARRFVLVSSDKAVRPTSVLGAALRLAEQIVFSLGGEVDMPCCVVRLGNILGSRGSVVSAFERQIETDGHVLVTHPEAARSFLSGREAASLVLRAGARIEGHELYQAEGGDSVKITLLAQLMGILSGKGEIEVKYTGLRPGEKLREEGPAANGDATSTEVPRLWSLAVPRVARWEEMSEVLRQLRGLAEREATERLLVLMRDLVGDYHPAGLEEMSDEEALAGARHDADEAVEARFEAARQAFVSLAVGDQADLFDGPPGASEGPDADETPTAEEHVPGEYLDPDEVALSIGPTPVEAALAAEPEPHDAPVATEPEADPGPAHAPELAPEPGIEAEQEPGIEPQRLVLTDGEATEPGQSRQPTEAEEEEDPAPELLAAVAGPGPGEEGSASHGVEAQDEAQPITDEVAAPDFGDAPDDAPPAAELLPEPASELPIDQELVTSLGGDEAPEHPPMNTQEMLLPPEFSSPPMEAPAAAGPGEPPSRAPETGEAAGPASLDLFGAASGTASPRTEDMLLAPSFEAPPPAPPGPGNALFVVVHDDTPQSLDGLLESLAIAAPGATVLLREGLGASIAPGQLRVLDSGRAHPPEILNQALERVPKDGFLVDALGATRFPPDFLARLAQAAEQRPDTVLFYGDHRVRGEGGASREVVLQDHAGCPHERFDFGPVKAYRAGALLGVGGFREDLRHAWEYDLHLRLMQEGLFERLTPALVEVAAAPSTPGAPGALHSPGRGPLGGFSYAFYPEDVEKEVTEAFERALKEVGAWLPPDGPYAPPPPDPGAELPASVVIPVLDRVDTIGEAIRSVQDGWFQDFEIVIVDNGSTDGTRELVQEIAKNDARVRLVEGTGKNIASALNDGVQAARGWAICQLDSDDLYLPQTLDRMIGHLEKEPLCALAISYYQLADSSGRPLADAPIVKHAGHSRNQILRRDGAGALRVYRRSVLLELGLFDAERFGDFGEDYDMVLRITEHHRLDRVPEVLYTYRRHEGNTDMTRPEELKYKNKNRARQMALRRRMALAGGAA